MLYPKEETLSRHSILGPNGLQGNLGQWARPVTGIRVYLFCFILFTFHYVFGEHSIRLTFVFH